MDVESDVADSPTEAGAEPEEAAAEKEPEAPKAAAEADLDTFLQSAKEKTADSPLTLSVRDLLAKWGAKRRGSWIVQQIRTELADFGLTTEPDFNDIYIDADVEIVALATKPTPGDSVATQEAAAAVPVPREIYLRVGSLPSANLEAAGAKLISVTPNDTVETAQALMMRYDFSQLPVMSGERSLRGAVSWESISQARIMDAGCSLADATVIAEPVRSNGDLLAHIPRIVSSGFVFVQAPDNRIIGIVTTADLSEAFARTASPFFMLGEIERQLRDIIDRHFSGDELAAAVDPEDEHRSVESADHLTFGEYIRLLEFPDHWSRLGWGISRKIFIEALGDIRQIRNEVMHFSPDPIAPIDMDKLNKFSQWLRKLRPKS